MFAVLSLHSCGLESATGAYGVAYSIMSFSPYGKVVSPIWPSSPIGDKENTHKRGALNRSLSYPNENDALEVCFVNIHVFMAVLSCHAIGVY